MVPPDTWGTIGKYTEHASRSQDKLELGAELLAAEQAENKHFAPMEKKHKMMDSFGMRGEGVRADRDASGMRRYKKLLERTEMQRDVIGEGRRGEGRRGEGRRGEGRAGGGGRDFRRGAGRGGEGQRTRAQKKGHLRTRESKARGFTRPG
jgi:hypothetical protein